MAFAERAPWPLRWTQSVQLGLVPLAGAVLADSSWVPLMSVPCGWR